MAFNNRLQQPTPGYAGGMPIPDVQDSQNGASGQNANYTSRQGNFNQNGTTTYSSNQQSSSNYQSSTSAQQEQHEMAQGSNATNNTFEFGKYTRTTKLSDCQLDLPDGRTLIAVWSGLDGKKVTAELDLDTCLGNEDGYLRWARSNFSQSSASVRLEGTTIHASCSYADSNGAEFFRDTSIDLTGCVTVSRGQLIPSKNSPRDLSLFMSEANWMRFHVVSQPDMSVLLSNPFFQEAITNIARVAISNAMEQTQNMMQAFFSQVAEQVERSAMDSISESLMSIVDSGALSRVATQATGLTVRHYQDYFEKDSAMAYQASFGTAGRAGGGVGFMSGTPQPSGSPGGYGGGVGLVPPAVQFNQIGRPPSAAPPVPGQRRA